MLSCDRSVYTCTWMTLFCYTAGYCTLMSTLHSIITPSQIMEFVSQEVYTSFNIAKEVPILLAHKVLHTRGYNFMLLQWAKTQKVI